LNNFQNILFDLDGTLTDPKEGIINSYLHSFGKLGIKEDNPESIKEYIGAPLQVCYKEKYGLNEQEIDMAITYYREYFAVKGAYENRLYEGIEELLNYLVHKKSKLYVVTNKATYYSEKIIRHFNIHSFFKKIFGSDMEKLSARGKEKHELIEDAIRIESLNPGNTIMIGDRKFDIEGAKMHGIKSIAVTYGYGSRDELEKTQPDYIVSDPAELKELLR